MKTPLQKMSTYLNMPAYSNTISLPLRQNPPFPFPFNLIDPPSTIPSVGGINIPWIFNHRLHIRWFPVLFVTPTGLFCSAASVPLSKTSQPTVSEAAWRSLPPSVGGGKSTPDALFRQSGGGKIIWVVACLYRFADLQGMNIDWEENLEAVKKSE